jgi:hypothetical protein
VKKLNGINALLRVRDGKPNPDVEHRVPTESGLQAQLNFFTAPLVQGGLFLKRQLHFSSGAAMARGGASGGGSNHPRAGLRRFSLFKIHGKLSNAQ